ncbi:RagB/SusD family nutrient uptake outer membrane protein [Snuella sedimenti]|uniref:RagB/SusD family nutrient uptake outer membrane protein n=1 Tax=Snuella sedimenti TaxID=2798802 RepID=A0A8J7IHU6_9FLAO|nr:RagB/SusD family nutrient uptake outer membrane protein [Snuella sedimenti]MBJ6368386.1 RagB/SusD family nutrient uptake outer membrane protein [Snuella sedimenti]
MKKTIKNSLRILGCLLIFISCDDYLDIQPEDKYLEETVFESEASVQNVINGIYIDLAKKSTYGGHLTMSTVDVLAQRYSEPTDNFRYYDLAQYNYGQSGVLDTFDDIWTNMYIRILNINKIIENLDVNIANIPSERLNVLKGEMFGLRAMLHFDLLRLFGPVYSVNSSDESIPYYNMATTDIQSLLPASEVIDMVLNDLNTSVDLLANDPVRTYGKIAVSEGDDNGNSATGFDGTSFYRFRNLRFNYFSAKALEARVHLYAGNAPEASSAAKAVIDEGLQWFEWVNPDDVISAGTNADRIFSSEVIFALQNVELYDRHDDYFDASINDNNILVTSEARLNEIFEGNLNDYRFAPNWKVPTNAAKTYKTFFKFQDVADSDLTFRYMQPLIRMSEMHYIVAETEADITIATEYLNAVREHRGLPSLDATLIDMPTELLKEYKREFYGEGQLFYYYKRNNMSAIEDGSDTSGQIAMDDTKYVLPLPESETAYRQD